MVMGSYLSSEEKLVRHSSPAATSIGCINVVHIARLLPFTKTICVTNAKHKYFCVFHIYETHKNICLTWYIVRTVLNIWTNTVKNFQDNSNVQNVPHGPSEVLIKVLCKWLDHVFLWLVQPVLFFMRAAYEPYLTSSCPPHPMCSDWTWWKPLKVIWPQIEENWRPERPNGAH